MAHPLSDNLMHSRHSHRAAIISVYVVSRLQFSCLPVVHGLLFADENSNSFSSWQVADSALSSNFHASCERFGPGWTVVISPLVSVRRPPFTDEFWNLLAWPEPALAMKESRRAVILTPSDDVSVEDLSSQVGEVEDILWSEGRAAPPGILPESAHEHRRELGDVRLRSAESGCCSSRKQELVVACAASGTFAEMWSSARACSWQRRLVWAGNGRRHHSWTNMGGSWILYLENAVGVLGRLTTMLATKRWFSAGSHPVSFCSLQSIPSYLCWQGADAWFKCDDTLFICWSSPTLRIGWSRILERFHGSRTPWAHDRDIPLNRTAEAQGTRLGSRVSRTRFTPVGERWLSWRARLLQLRSFGGCGSPGAGGGQRLHTGPSWHREERQGHFGVCDKAAIFAWVHGESGDHVIHRDLLDFVSPEVERDANSMKQTREIREEQFLAPEKQEGRYVARACGSGCAHPVSLAHSMCALCPISCVCNMLVHDDGAPHRTRSFASSAEVHDGHRALGHSTRRGLRRRLHDTSLQNVVVDALNSLAVVRLRVPPVQPPWLSRVLSKPCLRRWRMRRIGWLRSPFGASGCARLHGYARAPRSAGRWRSGSAASRLSTEGPWWVGWFQFWLRDSQRQRKWRLSGAVDYHEGVDPRVGKCRPRCRELWRALFKHGVIKFRRTARHHCGVFAVWNKNRDRHLIDARIPNTAFELPDPVALATGQSFARVSVDTNDPIYVCGVDMQVAFHTMGLLEPFQDLLALDQVEAWEIDIARVVDRGIVDSWKDVVFPRSCCGSNGWNQAVKVCQWVQEHIAEKVSGISATNRFTDFVAIPSLSPLVHMEYVDNFVCVSQQGSVARDAAERVSDALVACSRHLLSRSGDIGLWLRSREGACRSLSSWALAPPYCHASCRISGLGERERN